MWGKKKRYLVKGAKDKCRSEGAGWVERRAGEGAGRERGGGDGKLKMKLEKHGRRKKRSYSNGKRANRLEILVERDGILDKHDEEGGHELPDERHAGLRVRQ